MQDEKREEKKNTFLMIHFAVVFLRLIFTCPAETIAVAAPNQTDSCCAEQRSRKAPLRKDRSLRVCLCAM